MSKTSVSMVSNTKTYADEKNGVLMVSKMKAVTISNCDSLDLFKNAFDKVLNESDPDLGFSKELKMILKE